MELVPVSEIDLEVEPWISATQIDNYELCNRKWAWRWLEGVKAPPNKFAQLGLDTHGPMEKWLAYGVVPDGQDKPNQLAQALIPYCPPPQAVVPDNVEREELIVVDDVLFVLKVDLYMPSVLTWDGSRYRPRVYDHKTSKDPEKWAPQPDQIHFDTQAALYALWAILKSGERVVDMQWNYVKTVGAIKVHPVCATVSDEMIVPRMERSVQVAREIKWHLKNTKRALDVVHDVRACDEYGGCPYKDRCGITARERIIGIMSNDFKNQPAVQQFLGGIGGNGQPGLGPNGQPLVNPPTFQPPQGQQQFAPPATPQFSPPQMPGGQQQFVPPAGPPQFAPPAGPPQQFSPPAGPPQQFSPPAQQQQFTPPAGPPPQQQQFAPPVGPQPQQYAPQQVQQAPAAAWQPPAAAAPPQPAPAQQFVPPGATAAAAPTEKAGRAKASKEYSTDGAWARFAAAALPLTSGNAGQAAQLADALLAELKQRQ